MNIVLTSGFIYGKTEKLCRKEVKYSSSIGQELRKKKLIALMTSIVLGTKARVWRESG